MKNFLLSSILSMFALCAHAQTPQNALHFNGNNAHVTTANLSADLANNASFSMAAWIMPTNGATGFPNFDGAFGFRNESNFDFYVLQLSATNYEARFRNSNNQVFTINSPTVQLNVWQHVALVYTGTTLQFYHNGNLATSIPANGSVTNPNVPFFMGKLPFQNLNFEFNGRLDDVALWNRSLSAAEVLCLYQQALDTSMTGLVAYYPMNQGVAGGNNTAITTLTEVVSGANGAFNNMARNGTTNNFLAGVNKVTQYVDTICNGQQYVFGNQTFTMPGVYTFFASGAEGCDSLTELTLYADSVDVGIFQNGLMLTAALAGASYQWLECTSNAILPNETGQSLVVRANGSYAVIVDNGKCVDTSICVAYTTISAGEVSQPQANFIYPNPGNDRVYLSENLPQHQTTVAIYNSQYQLVQTVAYDASTGIVINQLASGVYWFQVSSASPGQVQHLRFVKL